MPQNPATPAPTPSAPMLALWVQDNSCTCGNRWVHSYLTHYMGGSLTAAEEHNGTIVMMHSSRRNHTYCYRCHRLYLNLDWIRPAQAPVRTPTKPPVDVTTLLSNLKNHLEP